KFSRKSNPCRPKRENGRKCRSLSAGGLLFRAWSVWFIVLYALFRSVPGTGYGRNRDERPNHG
ncbi:hypothetical protein, partial [Dubosiella newyorkensis]|uniref:hypothetical protein n=1 Tax=Dubosiella newyorkensis TaxID=1862672 RepID=UPI002729D8AA